MIGPKSTPSRIENKPQKMRAIEPQIKNVLAVKGASNALAIPTPQSVAGIMKPIGFIKTIKSSPEARK